MGADLDRTRFAALSDKLCYAREELLGIRWPFRTGGKGECARTAFDQVRKPQGITFTRSIGEVMP